jgi:hypothetical protein
VSQDFLQKIQSGATAEVAEALEKDPELAAWRDEQGVSALLWAVYTGQRILRDYLIAQLKEQGVALDVFEAAAIGDKLRLRVILDVEAEDHHEPEEGETGAAQAYSGDGWTALHLAAAFGTPAAVALLVEHGASVDAVSANAQRNQPLHAAMALGRNPETIRSLLEHGAPVNATQAGGFTPIYSAAAANRRDLAELLLAHGANPGWKNEQGKTPAEFARERGHGEMADWLESLAG